MNVIQILQTIQKSTSSGRGPSYWSDAANCGERRYLTDLYRQIESTTTDEKQLGTYFHGLMDARFKGHIESDVDIGPVQDKVWIDAVKMFSFVQEHFPEEYFGQSVASEFRLEPPKEALEVAFGHSEVSGQADRVVKLNEADVLRFYTDFGIGLPGPGVYILDWKTSRARADEKKAFGSYQESIQSKVYPLLWNLYGGEPCKGMIFFLFVNHADMRRTDEGSKRPASVQMFFAEHTAKRDAEAIAAVNFARHMRDSRLKNPYACVDYMGNECFFRANGSCSGV